LGIDVEGPVAEATVPEPELLAAIEQAVARGLRDALGERSEVRTEGETIANAEGEPPGGRGGRRLKPDLVAAGRIAVGQRE
jgi:hypothetical protein